MTRPVVYLDMDGVIAGFEEWSAEVLGPDWKQEVDKPEWGRYKEFPDLYSQLPVLEGAEELYYECACLYGSDRVHILTALPNRARIHFPLASKHKVEWARKHISPNIRVHFGPFAVDKQLHVRHKGDVLIDDMKINIDQWNAAGGTGILYKSAAQAIKEMREKYFET